MSIEVRNLSKVYGEQKAVDDISFKVKKGEIVGFLGPNGAGKSTTMKILTGFIEKTSGEAFICDMNVAAESLRTRKRIGYLPELNALYYDMFVREYLLFVAEIHEVKNAKKRIEEVIGLTGLTAESHKKIGQLSKGYKQRVGLAAALIHDPEVLILDEPTSGLDPNQIIEIREVIRREGKNKTVLFSSHILQEVEAICDRVVIIHQGRLVADSPLSELRRSAEGKPVVVVSFSGPVAVSELAALPGVVAVSSMGERGYRLETENVDLLRRRILEFALAAQLNIESLQSENRSLESVFRQLTGGVEKTNG
jgi:ABC-2 type transport system ATP-binding protein